MKRRKMKSATIQSSTLISLLCAVQFAFAKKKKKKLINGKSSWGTSSPANLHFHIPADKMKICLITNNYLLSMAFCVGAKRVNRVCSYIIIIIGENLLFYLTRLSSRSLPSVTCGTQHTSMVFSCNCNFIISINVELPFCAMHSMYHIIHQTSQLTPNESFAVFFFFLFSSDCSEWAFHLGRVSCAQRCACENRMVA